MCVTILGCVKHILYVCHHPHLWEKPTLHARHHAKKSTWMLVSLVFVFWDQNPMHPAFQATRSLSPSAPAQMATKSDLTPGGSFGGPNQGHVSRGLSRGPPHKMATTTSDLNIRPGIGGPNQDIFSGEPAAAKMFCCPTGCIPGNIHYPKEKNSTAIFSAFRWVQTLSMLASCVEKKILWDQGANGHTVVAIGVNEPGSTLLGANVHTRRA